MRQAYRSRPQRSSKAFAVPGGYFYLPSPDGIMNDESSRSSAWTGHIAANIHQQRRSAQRSSHLGVFGQSWDPRLAYAFAA